MDQDELARVKRRLADYQPLNPYILHALYVCACIGGSSSIVRGYLGVSYEEAGIVLNLGFWGGYLLVCLVFGPLVVRATYKDWRFDRDVQKLEEQRALAPDLAPVPKRA